MLRNSALSAPLPGLLKLLLASALLLPLFLCAAQATQAAEQEAQVTQTANGQSAPPVTDADGNSYKTVQIGEQLWMAENLRAATCSDGSSIPLISDSNQWVTQTGAAYTWSENVGSDPKRQAEYGALYNAYAAALPCNICPSGWRVPTQADFQTLLNTLNPNAHLQLSDPAYWGAGSTATNTSGFSARPTGGFGGDAGGSSYDFGTFAYFWSATARDDAGSYLMVIHGSDAGASGIAGKRYGFSVRCISEQPAGEVPTSAPTSEPAAIPLPAMITYTFTSTETKVLPGGSTEAGQKFNCKGTLQDSDKIGRLVIVSLLYQNGCWTDGRYNHGDYKVEQGQIAGSDGAQFEAYKVHPAAKRATDFLGSQHALFYQFPSKEDYTVYTFDGRTIKKALEVDAATIDPDQYTKLAALTISKAETPVTYIFVPSGRRFTAYPELAPGVEAAQLAQTTLGALAKYRYTINGTPFDTTLDYAFGPATWENGYSQTRQFFPLPLRTQIGVIWQDQVNNKIQLTKLGADLQSQQTVALPNNRNESLAAATSDGQETVYYLTLQDGGEKQNIARTATLYKVDLQGNVLKMQPLNTAPLAKYDPLADALDISKFEGNVVDMHYANGLLGIMMGRRLHTREDGLQHQSGVALVYKADTLAFVRNLGQTSGHSFDNVLTNNQAGQFVGIDLGDNFPRGVNLHKFDDSKIASKVVYTFKTEHGTMGVSGPKRSNDNRTYTELGGVVEGQKGYTVVFAGETSPDGKVLLNQRVGKELNDPRNIGLVQVKPDFDQQTDFVLTQGITETGGYYGYDGKWRAQENRGVIWLTDYRNKDQENVSRLKTVGLPDGNILLLWEKWTASTYVNTYGMIVTESGVKITEPIELGAEVRLNRRDDPLVSGNRIYLVAGDKVEQKLVVTVLQVDGQSITTAAQP